MDTISILDKEFELFVDSDTIWKKVSDIAGQIGQDYAGKNPLLIGVLNGAFIFAADLFRQMNIPAEISFIRLSSYSGTSSTGKVKTIVGLNENIQSRHIILVEDIIDTGKTMTELLAQMNEKQPASVAVASFLSKPSARTHDVTIDYLGLDIPDKFVVGYGLDYYGKGRNLQHLYALKGS